MSKLLSKDLQALTTSLGLGKIKTEEELRSVLIIKLAEEEVIDVDDTPLDELIDLYSALCPEILAEDEADKLAEEVKQADIEKPAKKVVAKKVVPVEEDEVIEEESDDDSEEEEEEAPVVKKTTKPVVKSVVTKEPVVKTEKTASKPKKEGKVSNKIDFSNKEHLKLVEDFKSKFESKKYDFKILAEGIAVRTAEINNTNRCLFVFNQLRVVEDGLKGHIAFNSLRLDKGQELIEENIDAKYTEDNLTVIMNNLPILNNVHTKDITKILNKNIIKVMEDIMNKYDSKLNKNREKMEEQMKTVAKKPAPAKK